MGIYDKTEEGNFVYISDNSPIELNNWNNGEPNDYGNGEDCVIVYGNGKWNDNTCHHTHKKSVICVREKEGMSCVLLSIHASAVRREEPENKTKQQPKLLDKLKRLITLPGLLPIRRKYIEQI